MSETNDWHNCIGVLARAQSGDNFIGTVFIPANGQKSKIELKEVGGNQQLTCQVKGKVVKYEISENKVNRIVK